MRESRSFGAKIIKVATLGQYIKKKEAFGHLDKREPHCECRHTQVESGKGGKGGAGGSAAKIKKGKRNVLVKRM